MTDIMTAEARHVKPGDFVKQPDGSILEVRAVLNSYQPYCIDFVFAIGRWANVPLVAEVTISRPVHAV